MLLSKSIVISISISTHININAREKQKLIINKNTHNGIQSSFYNFNAIRDC